MANNVNLPSNSALGADNNATVTMQTHSLEYRGSGLPLAFLMLKNFVLTFVTFGIYWPWARTAMRRYYWSETYFMGDRAAYTGTGRELFMGWLGLIAVVLGGVGVYMIVGLVLPKIIMAIFAQLIYGLAVTYASYGGRRYRLSRTVWRQIHFGVDRKDGDMREYLKLSMWGWFLITITLGLYYPYYKSNTRKFLTEKSRFGNRYFSYSGTGGKLMRVYSGGLILSILTLGLYVPWFIRNMMRFTIEHTQFDGNVRFELQLGGRDLLIYAVGSWLASVVTFGLAMPWIMNWGLRLFINNIKVMGPINTQTIEQMAAEGSAMADVGAVEYDLDLGF